MSDPVAAAAQIASSSAAAASTDSIALQTSIALSPATLAVLTRQIELNALLASAPTSTTIDLATSAGSVVLALPQLAALEQDKLQQQLLSIFESQKPVTVFIQAGNPPSQASVILPNVTNTAATSPPSTSSAVDAATSANSVAATPIAAGSVLEGLVVTGTATTPTPASTLTAITAPEAAGIVSNATVSPAETASAVAAPETLSALLSAPNAVLPPFVSLAAQEALGSYNLSAGLTSGEEAPATTEEPEAVIPASPVASTPEEGENSPGTLLGNNNLPSATPTASPLLTAGSTVALEVNTVIPAGEGENLALPATAAGQALATVSGSGPGGGVFLAVGSATVFVHDAVPQPVGTQLLLTIGKGGGGWRWPRASHSRPR